MPTNVGATIGANLFGGGLANAISGSEMTSGGTSDSTSAGGSYNSASSISGSQNSSESAGWSNTAGLEASANSAMEAKKAHERQIELLKMAQEFNSQEAQKQRKWSEDMANTVYTRSVKNMIEAGINPILAANLGLSGANVNSGATASVATPSSFMGQTFAEQNSANHASSQGSSFGNSSQSGSSWNSSQSHSEEWSNSQSGLATGLRQMAAIGEAGMAAINSSEALDYAMRNFGDTRNFVQQSASDLKDTVEQMAEDVSGYFKRGAENFRENGFMQGLFNSYYPDNKYWTGHY